MQKHVSKAFTVDPAAESIYRIKNKQRLNKKMTIINGIENNKKQHLRKIITACLQSLHCRVAGGKQPTEELPSAAVTTLQGGLDLLGGKRKQMHNKNTLIELISCIFQPLDKIH